MARSTKGRKGPGFDYWSRRRCGKNGFCAGYGPRVKRKTRRWERHAANHATRMQKLDAVDEVNSSARSMGAI